MLYRVHDFVCVPASLSSPEPLEVSKHEWYHIVSNCLGHVFTPSIVKKPKVDFCIHYYTGLDDPGSDEIGPHG